MKASFRHSILISMGVVLLTALSGSIMLQTPPSRVGNLQTSDSGTLKFTCDIKNGVPEDGVACRVTIDSVALAPDVAAGATQEFPVAAGDRNVLVEIVGPNATLFDPANLQKTVSVTAGKTATLKATFTKRGHLFLTTDKGLPANFYVDGVLVASQVVSTDGWVVPGKPHQILVNTVADPAAGPAYVWQDGTASATVASGKEKTVTVKMKQTFTKGFVNITCTITSGAANAQCIPTIDGVAQAPIASGATQQFLLDKGSHTVVVDLGPAGTFDPEQFSKKINVQLGKTIDIPVTFKAGPPVYRITLINKTSQSLCYVYISPTTSTSWGGNFLTNGAKIAVGKKSTFEVPAGTYDLYAEDCKLGTYPPTFNITVGPSAATYEWTVVNRNLPGGSPVNFIVVNSSSYSVCGIFIAPSTDTSFGWNWLSINDILTPGESITFRVPSGVYNFEADVCASSLYTQRLFYNLNVNTTWTLTD